MSKHTLGPWELIDRKDARGNPCGYSIWPKRDDSDCRKPKAIRNKIAETPDGTTPEANANARLIAAAPDLLAALNECVGVLTEPAIMDLDEWKAWQKRAIQDAITAIKKTT
jgi:hypothetical protein